MELSASPHAHFMRLALAEAQQAAAEDEVPMGAVIVHQQRVIARRPQPARAVARPDGPCRDDRHHAGGRVVGLVAAGGLHAVRDAGAVPDVRRGHCAGADSGGGVRGDGPQGRGRPARSIACWTIPRLNHRCLITAGVLGDECSAVLSRFFQKQRLLGKK